jgi:hypothetical protein
MEGIIRVIATVEIENIYDLTGLSKEEALKLLKIERKRMLIEEHPRYLKTNLRMDTLDPNISNCKIEINE